MIAGLYEEQLFIDYLRSMLPTYFIDLSQENNFDETSIADITPRIYFGHLGEHLHMPDGVWSDGYRELDNQCMLISELQICTLRSSLVTTVNAVKTAYKGWTPYPGDGNYSSMSFLKSSVAAYTANKIWWSEHVGVIIPRIS